MGCRPRMRTWTTSRTGRKHIPGWQREPWPLAVAHYCQTVLGMDETAVIRLLERAEEDTEAACLFRSAGAPSVTYNHDTMAQSCSDSIGLEYLCLRVRAKLKEEDKHLFGEMMESSD